MPVVDEQEKAGPDYGVDIEEVKKLPLTRRDGMSLREDVLIPGEDGPQSIITENAIEGFHDWYKASLNHWVVFANDEVACTGRLKNRFMPDKSDQRYAKLQDLIRGAKARYGRKATLTMFSMTGSTTFPNGRPRPVLDHAEDLDQSWESVRRGIHQVHEYDTNDDGTAKKHDFVYLAVPEPHESGHLHWHVVIISDEDFTETDFQTLPDRHVRNCPIAGPEAHKVVDDPGDEDDSCIECRDLSDIDNAAAYIAKYLGTYGEDPRDLPDHWQVFQTILWATDKRRWRPSQQAQTFMATADNPDPSEWEIVGVYDDGLWSGSINRVDPESVNRSYKMETGNKQSIPNTPYWQAEPPP
jgi:hypothetical protein